MRLLTDTARTGKVSVSFHLEEKEQEHGGGGGLLMEAAVWQTAKGGWKA